MSGLLNLRITCPTSRIFITGQLLSLPSSHLLLSKIKTQAQFWCLCTEEENIEQAEKKGACYQSTYGRYSWVIAKSATSTKSYLKAKGKV